MLVTQAARYLLAQLVIAVNSKALLETIWRALIAIQGIALQAAAQQDLTRQRVLHVQLDIQARVFLVRVDVRLALKENMDLPHLVMETHALHVVLGIAL